MQVVMVPGNPCNRSSRGTPDSARRNGEMGSYGVWGSPDLHQQRRTETSAHSQISKFQINLKSS